MNNKTCKNFMLIVLMSLLLTITPASAQVFGGTSTPSGTGVVSTPCDIEPVTGIDCQTALLMNEEEGSAIGVMRFTLTGELQFAGGEFFGSLAQEFQNDFSYTNVTSRVNWVTLEQYNYAAFVTESEGVPATVLLVQDANLLYVFMFIGNTSPVDAETFVSETLKNRELSSPPAGYEQVDPDDVENTPDDLLI